jgi:hypothetical protein
MSAPRQRRPLAPVVLFLLAACGADAGPLWHHEPEPQQPGVSHRRTGGPLANAGPDRQVLEGQVVRLDAGSSQPGEAGRALRYLWTVAPDGAVPLAIDDPTARRIRVVAPILPPGENRAEVRLRLRVDDGFEGSEDVVRLEVVRGPDLALAPVASAGPDLEVVAGDTVVLGPRSGDDVFVDPACGGAPCPSPRVEWTLVEGWGAEIEPLPPGTEPGCDALCARVSTDESLGEGASATDVVAVLSFRIDAVSALTGLAAAPDFARVFVKKSRRFLLQAPRVDLEPKPAGRWYVGTAEPLQVNGDANEPLGFRPILGEAEPVPGRWRLLRAAPDTPSFLGWAFEGRNGRLRSAPRFLLVDWRGLAAPTASAGADPMHQVDGEALPPDGCDRIRLVGTGAAGAAACAHGRAHPELEFCWRQTHGPAVLAGVPPACGERADTIAFGSDLAGCDSDLACPDLVVPAPAGEADRLLAFELRVRHRNAAVWSPPDTAVVRVVPGSRDDPPVARVALSRLVGAGLLEPLAGPAKAGDTVVVDASGSVDPEGQPLSFTLASTEEPPPAIEPYEPCAVAGACFAVRIPEVEEPTSFPLVLSVTAGETATVCGPGARGGPCLDGTGLPLGELILDVEGVVP